MYGTQGVVVVGTGVGARQRSMRSNGRWEGNNVSGNNGDRQVCKMWCGVCVKGKGKGVGGQAGWCGGKGEGNGVREGRHNNMGRRVGSMLHGRGRGHGWGTRHTTILSVCPPCIGSRREDRQAVTEASERERREYKRQVPMA